MRYYLSIEKNIEVFELYKPLWEKRGIHAVRADTMTEGIGKAIEIESSPKDDLYFIDIVADNLEFMPQLRILSEETAAPILIATSNFDDDEFSKALENGADYYGKYCETTEQNINSVIAAINSMKRRAKKPKTPSEVLLCNDLLIAPLQRNVFVDGKSIDLTYHEFELLHYLLLNRGTILSYSKIHDILHHDEYDETISNGALHSAIKRLRKKIHDVAPWDCIKSVAGIGYQIP